MYKLLIILMLTAMGVSVSDFLSCQSRRCIGQADLLSRDILNIDWQPIPVFPEEAKRFKKDAK